MKKKILKIALTFALCAIVTAPQFAAAESRWSVGSGGGLQAHADLNLEIIVPEIIILRVGDIGSQINTVTWSSTGTTANDAVYTGVIPPQLNSVPFTVSDDNQASDGVVAVQVFGNAGDVSLAATGPANFTAANPVGGVIPVADISVIDSGNINHPAVGGAAVSLTASSNIVSLSDTWTYAYAPTNPPAAGTYTATIRYTAANP